MRPLNPEAAPPLFHPRGSPSELGIRSAGDYVAGAAGGFSVSHFLPLRYGWAALPPPPSLKRDQRCLSLDPSHLFHLRGLVCVPDLCQSSRDPADTRELPGQGGGSGLSAKGPHLAQGWGKMLCDPDTHAGHRPDRERSKREELINQMLLIFFK